MKYVLVGLAVLLLLGLVGFFFVAPRVADARFNPVRTPPPYIASDAAMALHRQLLVADLHADFLLWDRDLLQRHDYGHVDLPRLQEGGVGLQVFAAVTKVPRGQNYEGNSDETDALVPLMVAQRWPLAAWTSPHARALHQAHRLRRFAERSDGALTVVRTRADLRAFRERRAERPESVAGLLAIEGLQALEGDPDRLGVLFDAGYRMVGLAHFFDTPFGGSAHGLEKHGLMPEGRRLVEDMERLGMVIDLAHSSEQTIDDVLAVATRPVVVSHTGVDATCPGHRNLSDRHVRGVAATGGVIGVGYWEGAVCGTGVAPIVRAMRHVRDLVGAEHVALGSDFDGTVEPPFDTSGLPLLTEALLQAGFTPEEVRLVMGENVLRVLRRTLPEA